MQYCTRCGRTKEEGESKAFVKVECSHCGAMNKRTNEYCFACGKSLLPGEKQAEKKVHDHDVEANLDALKKLAELRDMGILTEVEYREKKESIMAKI